MTIYLEEEGELKLPVDTETLAREAAEAALDEVGSASYYEWADPGDESRIPEH